MATAGPFDPNTPLSKGERLGKRIAELNAYLTVTQALFLELLREFDVELYWEAQGFKSCAHWLNCKCGLGMNAARERLRIAHALGKVSKIRAAFAEGRVSFSKVRAMTRIATPDNEDLLLNIAHCGTAYDVERFVSEYRRVEKLQQPGAAQAIYDRRELDYYRDEDGCLMIKARLPADKGELVLRALEHAMDSTSEDMDSAGESPTTREPIAARRADALCGVAESYLNHPENKGSTADRYQVVMHVHADAAPAASMPAAQIENGPHVSAETSERVTCDCSTTALVEDKHGQPLNIGRRSRTIPPPMRRALIARDGGCRFPGCTSHRYCDGHHIQHWQHGGETSLDNLVLLCRHHHQLVHEGGFDCVKSETGEIYFVDRRRERLAEFEPPTTRSIAASPGWMRRRFRRLDKQGCAANGAAGETIDWDHAMIVAFQDAGDPPPASP